MIGISKVGRAALLVVCAAVLVAGGFARAASAAPEFGVVDDTSLYADDGGKAFFSDLKGVGMVSDRWSATFDGNAGTITQQAFLDKAVPAAKAAGVNITISLYPASASIAGSMDPNTFCQWVGNVANRYKSVNRWIIGNEENTTRFWAPVSASNYEATLAACYDVLKGVNGNNTVIGFGISPRAQNAQSMTPVDFIKAVGAAYKASGRTKPIMDQVGIHPYPNQNAKPQPAPDQAGYSVAGDIGIPQMDVLKQAIYDAFNGTGQPTTLGGLMLVIDEVGYQTVTDGLSGYTGTEISPTVSESDQATYYTRIVQIYACDPSVAQVLFFHLVDEADRGGGWQSGLEHADGSVKPSKAAVASAISAGCPGSQTTWAPKGATASTTPATKVPSCTGTAPTPKNAIVGCQTGKWAIVSCKTGYADKDKQIGNGCEINLQTDSRNCGSVGNVVGVPAHALVTACAGGAPVISGCNPAWRDVNHKFADGCEAKKTNGIRKE